MGRRKQFSDGISIHAISLWPFPELSLMLLLITVETDQIFAFFSLEGPDLSSVLLPQALNKSKKAQVSFSHSAV